MPDRQRTFPLAPAPRRPLSAAAQHPRPDLSASGSKAPTPDGAILEDNDTSFAACWARFERQWLAPSNSLEVIEGLTWYDFRNAALEFFSAGGVHQSAIIAKFDAMLADPTERAIDRLQARSTNQGRRTTQGPPDPPDCSEMT
jgi:hypothetical protein